MGTLQKVEPKVGDLRVWWVSQVPGAAFHVGVDSPLEAKKVIDLLARYDLFQYENRIKPDYSNVGGLEVCEGLSGNGVPDWCEWEDENGAPIDDPACEVVSSALVG